VVKLGNPSDLQDKREEGYEEGQCKSHRSLWSRDEGDLLPSSLKVAVREEAFGGVFANFEGYSLSSMLRYRTTVFGQTVR
jgi:hypothetical protein